MYLPNLNKKLPRKGKNFTFVTQKFPKFNRQKLEVTDLQQKIRGVS